MTTFLIICAAIALAWILAYHRLSAPVWTARFAVGPRARHRVLRVVAGGCSRCCGSCSSSARCSSIPRRSAASCSARPLLGLFRRILPQVSQTEQEALDAGTVWWDGELFSGKPDWKKLLAYPEAAR